VDISEDGEKQRLIESVLDATQRESAVRVGQVENHDADGMAALATQRARNRVGAVA